MAKIQLSPNETELVLNSEWVLSKHRITKKVFEMFGELSEMISREVAAYNYLFPENIKYQNGKITKGENYKLLPYAILDHPAFFWKDRVFAVRNMFWWANFFSSTLHLSGENKQKFITDDSAVFSFLKKNNFYVCVNDDEWQHHFGEDNYKPAAALTYAEFIKNNQKHFFKISKKIPLTNWDITEDFFITSVREILMLLQISCPAGKKDP